MNVNLISLESSANCSSAALLCYRDGVPYLTEQISHQSHGHAEQLLPMIDKLLEQASLERTEIHGVVFGQGPGGFTGLRIAAGMAQGLGLGLDIPVFPVSSLLAVAETVRPVGASTLIVSMLDARMQEVFAAAYRENEKIESGDPGPDELIQVQAPCLVAAAQIPLWLDSLLDNNAGSAPLAAPGKLSVVIAGSGLREYDTLTGLHDAQLHPDAEPRAAVMARIGLRAWLAGRFIPADQAAPLYVRDKVAFTINERAQGQGGNPRAIPLSVTHPEPGLSDHQRDQMTAPAPASQDRAQLIRALQQHFTIRAMTDEDVDAVVKIECAVQQHPWTAGNFRDSLQAGYEAWVVCDQQAIIAFSLQLMAPDVAHLLLIGVLPNWQHKGIGTGLLAWTEDRVVQRHLDTQVLEVRPSNTRALAFYRKWHYKQIGVRKGYYPVGRGKSEDAWVMQKAVVS